MTSPLFITVHPNTLENDQLYTISNSVVLIILESCICCAASHLSYLSCVLGDPFPQLLFTLALCAVSSVADSVQCNVFRAWGDFLVVVTHVRYLQCTTYSVVTHVRY